MYMQIKDGAAIGFPIPRPNEVEIVQGGKVFSVGCAHWSDADLAQLAGIVPVVNGYDPALHIASGGGALVAGGVNAHYVDRAIADLRDGAKTKVDQAAEAARLRFITPGSAQAMVYQAKAAEARDLKAGGAGPWPHLQAEIDVTGATLDAVATVVLAMEAAWLSVSAAIEGERLAAKHKIDLANSAAAVDAVLADLSWPSPEVGA